MEIRVPRLAEGVDSGVVVSIPVAEGAKVQKDQTVLEIETKKAVAPITAPEAGVITKIHVKEGQEIPVGGLVMSLSAEGAGASASAPAAAAPKAAAPQPAVPRAPAQAPAAPAGGNGHHAPDDYRYESKSGFPPPASPSLRKMAQELGIDLTRVKGSAHGGRITTEDVRAYIERLQSGTAQVNAAPAAAAPAPSAAKPKAPSVDFSKWGPVTKKPFTPLRRAIAQAMVDSWTALPHVTQFDEADVTDLMALRKKHQAAYEKKGARLTVTTFLIKAVTLTLKKHPLFNASLDENTNEIVLKDYVHLGIAVDTEQGLIVPVLRDADKKNLADLSKDLQALAEKTRQRKVGLDELQGGTFTISNQGGIGGAHFTPIINKPEVAILGIGQGREKALVKDGKVAVRNVVPLGLSYDHRVIDGGSAARFIKDLVEAIENFDEKEVKLK